MPVAISEVTVHQTGKIAGHRQPESDGAGLSWIRVGSLVSLKDLALVFGWDPRTVALTPMYAVGPIVVNSTLMSSPP